MGDGVGLRTLRFGPREPGPHPTILIRTPYGIGWVFPFPMARLAARLFAERGYQVVLQDTRGRYGSQGTFYPFVHEREDGAVAVDWIGKQPWFGGRLAMWGGSYFGYTQWAVAASAPPFLKAIVPIVTSTDFHGFFYPGGAFSLISALRWAAGNGERRSVRVSERRLPAASRERPMREATRALGRPARFFEDWTDHPRLDDYWKKINLPEALERSRIHTLSVAGTYDIFCGVQIADYLALRDSTWLDLGPFAHGNYAISTRRLGWKKAGIARILSSSLGFLDHHLRGIDLVRARVRRYVQGADHWVEDDDWPPPQATRERFYIRSRGRLDREAPGGDEEPDRYRYDPVDPVPTRGGTFLGPRCGPQDQRPLEGRRDILFYETAPLSRPLEIAGPVRLRLFASTDAPATDFSGKLVHVPADWRRPALNLCEGIRRVESASSEPSPLEIDLWSASAEIPAGDRLRLEISSSNFPRFDAHPNVLGNPAHATEARIAQQRIHHAAEAPSFLELHLLS
jgi:putative CocE/NonD family hydrolase